MIVVVFVVFFRKKFVLGVFLSVAGLTRGGLAFKTDTEKGISALKVKGRSVLGNSEDSTNDLNDVKAEAGSPSEMLPEFKLVFHHLTGEQERDALANTESSLLTLEDNMTLGQIKNTWNYDSFVKNIAKDGASFVEVPQYLVFGLMIAESKGQKDVVSKTNAVGIMQLMEDKARELGLRVDGEVDDRLDPYKSITAAVKYLKTAYQRYQDWGLAFWEWHLGPGHMWNLLSAYFQNNINFPAENYGGIISGANLDVYKLLNSSAAREFFREGDWDYTQNYIYNIVAGSQIYRQFEKSQ